MPRNYVPRQKTYNELQLQQALDKVKNGELSFREAESKYKVDKSLLWRKVHNLNTSKQGRKTVLSKEAEKDLADKIKIMAKWGWALTRREIMSIVHTYVVQNNLPNNFKNNYPGKDWLQLFFQRNGLVAKKLEQLEKSRRKATSDPFIVYHFYDILEKAITSLALHDKPQHIFNLDETYFSADPSRIKGVTGKGQNAHRSIQGSGKENTTVLGCISAEGRLLPPLIIFKGMNLWSSWKGTKDIPGTTYACSEKGWMMTSIFNEWFANFCKTVTERPLLIIFDGHVTHLDPATIELAIRENVTLLKLPPHTTDVLQPMDRSCFGPIKYKWNERLIEWQRLNQRSLSKTEFCDLLSEVWRDGLSQEVIQNSFRVTGIYPVNKDVYPKDRLDPVKLDRFYKAQASGDIPSPMDIFEDTPSDNTEYLLPSLLENEPSPPVSFTENNERQPRSATDICIDPCQNIPGTSTDPDKNACLLPACSFENLLLDKIKYTKPAPGKRRKIDGMGKLLTTEEYLKSIENLDKPKIQKKKQQQKKNLKRKAAMRTSDTDTDSEVDEGKIPYEDESDLEDISLSEIIQAENEDFNDLLNDGDFSKKLEAENQQIDGVDVPETNMAVSSEIRKDTSEKQTWNLEYGKGDFVLIKHAIKNKNRFYVARVEGLENEHLTVVYLKRSKKIFFIYPDTHIMYTVHKDEVVIKLSAPMKKSKRGPLIFDIDFEKYQVE